MPPSELATLVGQLFVFGPAGATFDTSLAETLDARLAGGLILFARNCPNVSAVKALIEQAQARAHWPLWIMIDQEGGRVRRLKEPQFALPAPRLLAELDPEELRQKVAVVARALGELGIHINLAPLLDVDSNPANPVIGDRAFSSDPERVFELASIYLAGLQDGGLLGCGKHFPGHGDTLQDSHLTLPRVEHDLDRLSAVEILPFARAVKAQWPLLMIAHVLYPALDAEWPASLSARIGQTLLREALGFEGLLLSDDIEMKAVSERYPTHTLARGLLAASVDQILVCSSYSRLGALNQAVLDLVASGEFPRAALDARIAHIRRHKAMAGLCLP